MSHSFRKFSGIVAAILLTIACLSLSVSLGADAPALGDETRPRATGGFDWPQFLGPNRNGISSETKLLQSWPADGPKVIWRAEGGAGMSGTVISHGKLFTLVQKEGKQWAIALEARSGKPLWETPLAEAYRNQMGDGPRATPAVSGEFVVTFTGEGILTSLKVSDGTVLWSHNVVKELEGAVAEYGMACSPLVVGDRVIVTAGAPAATVVAYHRTSGKLLWKSGRGDAAGYSSPALMSVGGRPQVVVFSGEAAFGIDPDSGFALWRYPYKTYYNCNIATPLAYKGKVFISSGENHGSVLLSLRAAAESFTVGEVWKSNGGQSVLRNEWQTSIFLDGYLYGLDNVGGAGPITHLVCVDADTGKRMWRKPRFGKSNLIAADGKLFFSTMQGELVVVRANPKAYEEIGRTKIIDRTRQAPALSHGLLYLRDGREIVCLDVRAP